MSQGSATMTDELTLAEYITARFSHDIAGPVGAVNNGTEFLNEEDPQMKLRALELIETSAKEAVTRLKFYRQAYGAVSSDERANLSLLRDLTQQLYSWKKTLLEWPETLTDNQAYPLSPTAGKLLLNFVIIVGESLLNSGEVHVAMHADKNKLSIAVKGQAPKIRVADDLEAILADEEIDINSHNVQLHLTKQLARKLGTTIAFNADDTHIMIQTTIE